jgi:hypothetical protein
MTKPLMSFSSYRRGLSEESQRKFLECLDSVSEIFPIEMKISDGDSLVFRSPAQYDRSGVPDVYRIDGDSFRIPLFSPRKRLEIVFVESDNPRVFPAQVHLSPETLHEAGLWPISNLIDLIERTVAVLSVDVAHLLDESQLEKEVFSDRMCSLDLSQVPLGIFWINYFSQNMLESIGESAVKAIYRKAALTRNLQTGLVFATQKTPFDPTSAADNSRLRDIEASLNYRSFTTEFPLKL